MTSRNTADAGTHPQAEDECPTGGRHCSHWDAGDTCCYCEDEDWQP